MKTLAIDIETYSSIDLISSGVFRYAGSPDFEIMLFGYAFGDEPAQVLDLTKEELPEALLLALTDPEIIKTAYNAQFERACLAAHFKRPMPPEQWRCTMVHALMAGLPRSLAQAAEVLKLDEQKMAAGKKLIRFFCVPYEPSEKKPCTRNMPAAHPGQWNLF
jgi:DNA polymerase